MGGEASKRGGRVGMTIERARAREGRNMETIKVTRARLASATPQLRESGLLGFVECDLNDCIRIEGIALRRTLDGRRTLSFPMRKDGAGREVSFVRPLDDATRRSLEEQIYSMLGITI